MQTLIQQRSAILEGLDVPAMFEAETSENRERVLANRQLLASLPVEQQAAFGYVFLCMAAATGFDQMPSFRFFQMVFRRQYPEAHRLLLPVSFLGFAGEHCSVGPAYRIEPLYFTLPDTRIFYSDDRIARDPEEAQLLADAIRLNSRGLRNVHAGTVRLPGDGQDFGCVWFEPDADAGGCSVTIGENPPDGGDEGCILVVPQIGEFRCQITEIRKDLSGFQQLETKSYCLK
ncbi:MAG: hypothetical protein IJK02_05535 [Clostridia bacterium]|nr:hypothetical protein [Clostridia bacterium]